MFLLYRARRVWLGPSLTTTLTMCTEYGGCDVSNIGRMAARLSCRPCPNSPVSNTASSVNTSARSPHPGYPRSSRIG